MDHDTADGDCGALFGIEELAKYHADISAVTRGVDAVVVYPDHRLPRVHEDLETIDLEHLIPSDEVSQLEGPDLSPWLSASALQSLAAPPELLQPVQGLAVERLLECPAADAALRPGAG
jgi:hypothetical protein